METIAALATAWGRSALAVLRVSGSEAQAIVQRLCPGGADWVARRASLRRARDSDGLIDQVMVVWMPGPNSYTGEDVVELICHGNPVIYQSLLDRLVGLGARIARPGEFTRRAVLNGRLDLLQAESISAVIEAGSIEGARLALRGIEGRLGRQIAGLRESLLDCCAEMEARLDHPGEDLGMDSDLALARRLKEIASRAHELAGSWQLAKPRIQGARVALVGHVNAGKSSLFNHLVGRQRALVSDVAGTTRDVVESSVLMGGLEVTFLDTAGRRGSDVSRLDPLEEAGIAMGMELIEGVDLEIWVHRLDEELDVDSLPEPVGLRRLIVGTHSDQVDDYSGPVECQISNLSGEGLGSLQECIRQTLDQGPTTGQQAALTSQRQHDLALKLSADSMEAHDALLGVAGVAVAAEALQLALQRLAELSGDDSREDVLDRLFSRFCIGK